MQGVNPEIIINMTTAILFFLLKKRQNFNGWQALKLTDLIDQPQQGQRRFWTAKTFHGYISKAYQIHCNYETVVRFFHKQGYEEKLLERLDQAVLDVMNNPKKIQKTACIGTLL